MEQFEKIMHYAGVGVMVWGAGLAAVGLITFAEGYGTNNAAKKEEGMGKIVGGGVIFLAGWQVVPLITQLLLSA